MVPYLLQDALGYFQQFQLEWALRTTVEFIFTCGCGHVSEVAFIMCGNSNKVFSTDNSPQLTFRFIWPAWVFEPTNFKNRRLYTSVGQPKKRKFSIKKIILGWKSTTGKAAFQSNFKPYVEDTLKFFRWRANNIYVTLYNSRLFTYRINSSEGFSKLHFSFEYQREQQWKHSISLIFERRL